MRVALAKTLAELADDDPRIMLITADLGYMALEPFSERHPKRFFNVGVAEQNMVGLATGLAEAGFIPFLYSIVTFASMRAYEFFRNGPILQHLPVRLVGVGGGFEYGSAGPTHFGLEDLAIMRTQPELRVIAPADHEQTRTAVLKTWALPGPIYYRLGKDDKTTVPGLEGRFDLDGVATLGDGNDILFITTGSVTSEVVAAAAALAHQGVHATVVVVSTLNPPPLADLLAVLRRFPVVLTVEAHYLVGGLGSMIAEIIADHGLTCRTLRLGVSGSPNGLSGSQAYHYRVYGLDREALAATAVQQLART
jgi:transketolase